MKTYQVRFFSRSESGTWQPVSGVIECTRQDLETAEQNKYRDAKLSSFVSKIPQLPVSIHSLRFVNGDEWDCINGFR
jgi:hypothetical protein